MGIGITGFLQSDSATLLQDTDIVTLTGSVDASYVVTGTAVFLDGQLFEGKSGSIVDAGDGTSTITLTEVYTGADITAVKLLSFNTIEGLRDAIRSARDIVLEASVLQEAFGTVLTSIEETIDITINGVPTPITPYGFLVLQVEELITSAEGAEALLLALEGDVATLQTTVDGLQASVDADKAAAAASAAAALVSEQAAAADVITTNADAAATALDKIATNADVVITNADVLLTNADVVATALDAVATSADAVATALDKTATNADVVITNSDVVITNADVVTTNADAAATALDKIATNADVVITNADVVTTNADVVATALSESNSATSESNAATSETNSATSETNALASENKAAEWADKDENLVISGEAAGTFSAKHWAAQAQASATGALIYRGAYDASLGVFPTVPTPELGDFYKISVAGTLDLAGPNELVMEVGDHLIFNDPNWDKIDNTESVTSVAGRVGAIVLSAVDISDFDSVSGGYGSVQVSGASGTVPLYEGFSIGGRHAFIDNSSTLSGIFNDTDDEWILKATDGGSTELHFNGVKHIETLVNGSRSFGTVVTNYFDLIHDGSNGYLTLNGVGDSIIKNTVVSGDVSIQVTNTDSSVDTAITVESGATAGTSHVEILGDVNIPTGKNFMINNVPLGGGFVWSLVGDGTTLQSNECKVGGGIRVEANPDGLGVFTFPTLVADDIGKEIKIRAVLGDITSVKGAVDIYDNVGVILPGDGELLVDNGNTATLIILTTTSVEVA